MDIAQQGSRFTHKGHRSSTPTTDETIAAVKKIILDNRRITIRKVTDDVGISLGSCQAIFKYVLGMTRAAAKIILFYQIQRRMDIHQRRSRFGQKGHNW